MESLSGDVSTSASWGNASSCEVALGSKNPGAVTLSTFVGKLKLPHLELLHTKK